MSLKERLLAGETLEDLDIIDAHMHLNSPPFYVPASDWKSCIHTMDKYGISRGISAPELAITCSMEEGNSEILEIAAKTDRLLAYCTINPHCAEKAERELERCFAGGAAGIKIHPGIHKVPIDDKRYYPVYEYASETGRTVLTHTWGGCGYSSPHLCVDVLETFPHVTFILAHTGGSLQGMREVIDVIKRFPGNTFTDISGSTQFLHRIEILCREVSAEKVVYGSDSPWMEPGLALGAVIFASVSDEEKKRILPENIKHILNIG